MATKRTWLWVGLGAIGLVILGFAALAGIGVALVMRSTEVTSATASGAEIEFAQVRDRFKGQAPLLRIDQEGDLDAAALEERRAASGEPRPTALHVLAWEPNERKLVRLTLPMWLLRLSSGGSYNVDLGGGFKVERVRIDPRDLERAGSALVLDHEEDGVHVMLWTE